MFGSWKEKLISVGKNVKLFSDLRGQSSASSVDVTVNLDAGALILNHFQDQWEELHNINEENAEKAAALANTITKMHEKISKDHRNVIDMTHLLSAGTNTLSKSVEGCVTQLQKLSDDFEGTEKALLQLENLIETLELQEKQLEHRFQLAMYKERKLANLETMRAELATKHAESVIEHELKQKQVLRERQQTFQEVFQTDMQTYKEVGHLPKIEKPGSSKEKNNSILEEIQLDYDSQALDQFLNQ